MVLQCFCMMEETQGSWGLNEMEIARSGFSFFSTFFKATSLGIALSRTIAESTIEDNFTDNFRENSLNGYYILESEPKPIVGRACAAPTSLINVCYNLFINICIILNPL